MPDGTANSTLINTRAAGPSKRACRRPLGVMALEPRVMYDAAAGATVATTVLDPTHAADTTTSTTATTVAAPSQTDALHTADTSATQSTAAAEVAPIAVAGAAPADSATGNQVVFIDPHVPDYQLLAAGVKSGEQVVILDANTDGVQQIADWLASHDPHNVDAIHIVSHGEDGTVRLGSTILATNDVNQFAQPLAQIGAALKPGGDILFYGCDVGQGAVGDMFMVEMSMATGGAHIAAASHLVGAASQGGSWDLNAQLGSIDVGNPFTAPTLAAFNDVLTNQIWFTTSDSSSAAGTRIEQIAADGSGATDLVDATTAPTNLGNLNDIVVDVARGKYFVVDQVMTPDGNNSNSVILQGSLATGALDPTPIYVGPSFLDATETHFINGQITSLQLDAASGELYFAQSSSSNSQNLAGTGIFKIGEDGSGLTPVVSLPTTSLDVARNFALDIQDNLVFFTDNSGRGAANSDGLGIANLTTGATSFVSAAQLAAVGVTNTTGLLSGIAVDPAHGMLYFTSMDTAHTDHNFIFSAPFTVSGSGTTASATLGTITTLYNVGSGGAPASIVLDVPDGLFYVANKTNAPDSGTSTSGSIEVGRLDGSQPLSAVFQTSSLGLSGAVQPINLTFEARPTLTAGGNAIFTQNGPAVTADAGLTAVDGSNQDFASATVAISSGFYTGDTLTVNTTGTNIAASYDSTTGVLTLTGNDTPAHYQQVLETVSFGSSTADPTNGGADTQRTLTWTVTDSVMSSNVATSMVMVHKAPIVTAGASATFTGGGGPVTLDGSLTVSDPDGSGNLASATVSISGGFTAGDTLNFADQNGITGSYNAGTGALTLTGSASLAVYQAALDSITYSFNPANGDPTGGGAGTNRTISWLANNGAANSTVVTSALTTVHVAPTVGAGGTATFTGGGAPVMLDGTLTVSDPDSGGMLTGATVSVSGGFTPGDTLSFTGQNGITGSYDGANGTLTLSGTASVASYQAVLDSVTYSFTPGGDPTGGGAQTTRTISWSTNDGVAASNTATSTLTTVHVPANLAAGSSATFIGGGSPVTLDGTLALADIDSNGNLASATVAISSGFIAGDALNFTNQNGIAGSYDAVHGVLTLTGTTTLANYQTALQSITYSFTAGGDPTGGGGNTARTIGWAVNDGASVSTDTSTVTTVHVPANLAAGANATFTGGGSPVTLDGALTLADVDSNGNLDSATVAISSGFIAGDTLNFTNQNGITGSYDASTGALTLTGTASVASYQTALQSITYSFSPGGDPTGGGNTARTISWTVNDGASLSSDTSTLTTVHVPANVAAGGSATFIGGGSPVTLDGTLALADVDSNGNLDSATVAISSGFIAGDTLNFTNQNGITGSYDAVHGVLTLTGTTTLANYQAALQSVTYSFTAGGDPTGGGGNTARTISWTVNDGASRSTDTSALATVHVAPSVVPDATATYTGGGLPVILDGGMTVSDVDSSGNLASATVSIGSGFITGDTLNFNSQNGITGSYDAVHGVLTLAGTTTLANYETALNSITYSFAPGGDPTGGGANTARTISWTVSDGVANSLPATTTLTTVHTPPSISAGGTVTFIGGGQPVALDGNVTVSDPDSNGNLASATVSIGSGFIAGDTLNFTSQNGITGSYDAAHGMLTLTGTATLANYQKALESITYSFTPGGDPTQGGHVTRTVSWSVYDGVADSVSATSTVSTVNATHVAPTIAGAGNTTPYSKQGPAVVVDGALTLSDPDSSNMLTGATVTLSSGFLSGDTLAAVTSGTGIKASYNAGTGVLTLAGQDTIAHYQSVLDSVTYSSTDNNPSQGNKDTTRTITWVVNDGATSNNLSSPVTSTIDLTPGQSGVHAPHGKNAAPVVASSATAPTLGGSTRLVTYVDTSQSADGDEHDTVPDWTATPSRGERDDHAAVDLRHAVVATDAELLAARRGQTGNEGRHLGEGDKPAHGKPGLLAQLKAAGRHGLVHERQALIKDLHKRSAAR
jgi:hypothetical protein